MGADPRLLEFLDAMQTATGASLDEVMDALGKPEKIEELIRRKKEQDAQSV